MFILLKRLARLFERLKQRFLRVLRPRFRRAGRWVDGNHREPRGALAFAPMIAPHRPYRLYLPAGYSADNHCRCW